MIIHKFKNGNVTLKAEPNDYDREDMLMHVLWALEDKDFSLFGDEYCLGNAIGMAVDCYDHYNDRLLMVPYTTVEELKAGKTVRFYSRPLTEDDFETRRRLIAAGRL